MPDDTTHDIKVVPPLLRKEVKRLKTSDGAFVHGYMVNSGAGISADDFDISRLISFADTFKPNDGFRQWANHSEFMFLPICWQPLPQENATARGSTTICYNQ